MAGGMHGGEHAWHRGMHGRGACVAGGVHGRGMCVAGGVHSRGACMAGRGHAWQVDLVDQVDTQKHFIICSLCSHISTCYNT